jgi:lysophospholipase L1-like esterase
VKLSRKIAFSLIPVVVFVAGAEIAARVAGWPEAQTELRFEHNQPYWIFDPDLDKKAYPHRETGGKFTVSTDANGLRAPIHAQDPGPADPFRIMFTGCSTTFGWGVDDHETYAWLVESMLREGGHSEVEVINAGQPGHTSFQGEWLYRTVASAYRPDLVFFGYVVQDARKAAYSDASQALLQQDAHLLKQSLLYRSRLYLGLLTLVDEYRIRAKEREDGGEDGVYRVSRSDFVDKIRSFQRMTASHGGELVLFDFPLERSGYTAEHRRLVRIASEELGLRHLDIQAEIERASDQQTLYFPEDPGHANAAGHQVIAEHVVRFLETKELLP